MKTANFELRQQAKALKVPLWAIAARLGISEPTMTRKLRTELPEAEKQTILSLIHEIKKEQA